MTLLNPVIHCTVNRPSRSWYGVIGSRRLCIALRRNDGEHKKQYDRLSDALGDNQLKGLFGHDRDDLRRSLVDDIGTSALAFDDNACEFVDVTVDGVPAVYIHSAFTTRVPLSV